MNAKLNSILGDMIIKNTELKSGFNSSAKEFRDQLKAKGIRVPFKIYYEYKIPEGLTPQEYEFKVQKMHFILYFDGSELEPYGLTPDEKQELVDYIKRSKASNDLAFIFEEDQIRKLNPELKNIDLAYGPNIAKRSARILNLLEGVTYGFAPEDIQNFLNRHNTGDKEQLIMHEKADNATLEKLLGFSPGYILSPERMAVLIKEAKRYRVRQEISNMAVDANFVEM
ncbi:MAG: hypothetical protein FWE50_02865 [Alphaproteobacteria bacterium]|nr:hypothetical protein [Alphaproteobacteria bacterium]